MIRWPLIVDLKWLLERTWNCAKFTCIKR